jgi:hypothetical protein
MPIIVPEQFHYNFCFAILLKNYLVFVLKFELNQKFNYQVWTVDLQVLWHEIETFSTH